MRNAGVEQRRAVSLACNAKRKDRGFQVQSEGTMGKQARAAGRSALASGGWERCVAGGGGACGGGRGALRGGGHARCRQGMVTQRPCSSQAPAHTLRTASITQSSLLHHSQAPESSACTVWYPFSAQISPGQAQLGPPGVPSHPRSSAIPAPHMHGQLLQRVGPHLCPQNLPHSGAACENSENKSVAGQMHRVSMIGSLTPAHCLWLRQLGL